jgi:rhodanese-related sulfurtransferase
MKLNFAALVATAVLTAGFIAPAAASTPTPPSLQGVKLVTAEQARDLQAKGAPMIDTRVAAEFAEKSIKGAIGVTYREKSAKVADFDVKLDSFDLSKLPADKNAPVVVFCNAGDCWRSYKAAVVARDAGYKQVHWLRGGMPEWLSKGLPTQ